MRPIDHYIHKTICQTARSAPSCSPLTKSHHSFILFTQCGGAYLYRASGRRSLRAAKLGSMKSLRLHRGSPSLGLMSCFCDFHAHIVDGMLTANHDETHAAFSIGVACSSRAGGRRNRPSSRVPTWRFAEYVGLHVRAYLETDSLEWL